MPLDKKEIIMFIVRYATDMTLAGNSLPHAGSCVNPYFSLLSLHIRYSPELLLVGITFLTFPYFPYTSRIILNYHYFG